MEAHSNVNSIWNTASKSCQNPGSAAPIAAAKRDAPLHVQETFASITATVSGTALAVTGSPYANEEPLHVTVDGTSVATTATATEDGKLAGTVITLTAALPAGPTR
jgi:hypothetical protein